jgi:tetratricopeptide (TPR) repeat protein
VLVPEAYRAKGDAELVIRFDAPRVGVLEASRKLADLAEVKPPLRSVLYLAGEAEKANRHEEVKARYELALKHHPSSPSALGGFARYLATAGDPEHRDAPRAVALARRAVKRTGEKNGAMLDTLAIALHLDGRLEEAVRYAEMAAKRSPEKQEIVERARAYRKELDAGAGDVK